MFSYKFRKAVIYNNQRVGVELTREKEEREKRERERGAPYKETDERSGRQSVFVITTTPVSQG